MRWKDNGAAKAEPPEKELKDLENLIKNLKGLGDSSQGSLFMADLQRKLQVVKEKVRQARPLPVRLQSAVKLQEAAGAAVQAALEAAEKSRQIYEAKQAAVESAKAALAAANYEVSEVQAQLGRPQLEAGANAAVAVCVNMLQQHGMSDEHAATFVEALRIAFGAGPAQVAAQVAASPFVVMVEAGAGREAAAAAAPAMGSLFAAGGSFPSQGFSAFGNLSQGPTQEEVAQSRAEAQRLEAQQLEAQRLEWAQSRADALTSLKQRLEAQRLKHGAAATRLAAAQEAAKKAEEAGAGGEEEAEQSAEAEKDVQAEQTLIEAMEAQRAELESEAFGKAAGNKPARSSPF